MFASVSYLHTDLLKVPDPAMFLRGSYAVWVSFGFKG